MSNLSSINKQIKNLFNQSKKLDSNKFNDFLNNLELVKQKTIKVRQKPPKLKLVEISFKSFISDIV